MCPKCKSDKVQAIQETETKGFSNTAGTAGCCCMGPVGILCGLFGSGKSKSKMLRMCMNCGNKF